MKFLDCLKCQSRILFLSLVKVQINWFSLFWPFHYFYPLSTKTAFQHCCNDVWRISSDVPFTRLSCLCPLPFPAVSSRNVLAQCPRSFLSSLYQAKTLIQVLTPSSHHSCAFLSVLGMDRIQLNCRLTVVFIEFVTYSFESWCTQRVQHSQDLTVSYREQSRASLCACIAL